MNKSVKEHINKKAVFFSIDALVAIMIIFFVILISYPQIKETKREIKIQEDIIVTLSAIKAGEIDDLYMQSLITQGLVADLNKSVLEVIGYFYVTNKTIAQNLASSVLNELDTPENIGLWYGSTLLASKNSTPYENAKTIETTRQLISGIQEGGSVTGFAARAQLTPNRQTKYIYFGGYVGDGHISAIVEYNGTIKNATIELAINNNFDLYVNNNLSGSYNKSPSTTTPINYTIPINNLHSGINKIELRGNALYIAGGFIKITYDNFVQYEQPTRYYLPGINGTINLYDSIYVPGQINTIDAVIHYKSSYKTFLSVGNKTIYNGSSANETTIVLANSQLATLLEYSELGQTTTPIRFGLENASFNITGNGEIDVILITDVSGSMDWRLNNDNTGIARNCTDPLLTDPSTKRISLAKCIDKDFVATILNGSTNSRIALVSFANAADSYTSLTRNQALLNTTIDNYVASGSTCISCAINRAYTILQTESNSSRQKYILTMTDGVANRRSTSTCSNLLGEGSITSENIYVAGEGGLLAQKQNNIWNTLNSPISNNINDIDMFNSTLGFAVGDGGKILKWDGTVWNNISSPLSSVLRAVDIYNNTFALAVGDSGKVLKWNGASWSVLTTLQNSPAMHGVSIANSTLMFASGARSSTGRIYKSTNNGASWSIDYNTGNVWRDVEINQRVFAVGNGGQIAQWTGGSWSSISSPTTENLYRINAYNSTLVFAVGGNNAKAVVIKYNGASWSTVLNVAADSLRDVEIFNNKTYAAGEGGTLFSDTNGWHREFDLPQAYQGNSSSGITCTADDDSCSAANSYPSLNANYSSCRTRNDLGATVYSVGFGPIATCSFATQTLQAIASCGNGTLYSSSNASLLQQFYTTIAQTIIQLSYAEQTSQLTGNESTILYPDSYIEVNYTKIPLPYGLLIATEKQFDNTTTSSFSLPLNATLVEARAISYSGPRWTSLVRLNNNTIFNLTRYGNDYTTLGDPYSVYLPTASFLPANTLTLLTGVSPNNLSAGSASNKILTTVVKNATGYSPIAAQAIGCIWNLDFEQSNATLYIPSNYTGTDQCDYQAAHHIYEQEYSNDAFKTAVYRLLQNLDLNTDGIVDITLTQEDVAIDLTELTGIPYTVSTEIQVRTWR